MKYEKSNYIGKTVRLYPGDTYYKIAKIENLDDLGFWFRIIECSDRAEYKYGDLVFINHAKNVSFVVIGE